ncbi:uncharacterized protein BX663DRAFT_524462 [Cokeromyces recurvatus]|uniref:uncharacterized protein n=1 Tax=Cokeromyces recurvatus TaxID=90255 RepID=UPI002220EF40|nr:uncharacterized protein BX663DRAFT_524462 [Cokeromyces recurvatus]KAI7898531.1 hypothetical protein BX663DRAFT_524462 [Cokeromyces recurvatus]
MSIEALREDLNTTIVTQEKSHQEEDFEINNNNELTRTSTLQSVQKKMTNLLDNIVFAAFLIIIAGACVAFQAGCNATLNRYGGRSFSSVISFSVGLICCLLFFTFDITLAKTPLPTEHVKTAPWYAWIGGILGAYYVIINILTVPRLGAATVLSIFVCAQIITACLIDNFALVGVEKRPYTIWRILASLGLVGCVVVIAKF